MTTTRINRDAQLSTIANAAYLDTPPLKITIGGVTWEYVDKSASTSASSVSPTATLRPTKSPLGTVAPTV